MDAAREAGVSRRAWWPLFARVKAAKGTSLIGWWDDWRGRKRRSPAPIAKETPEHLREVLDSPLAPSPEPLAAPTQELPPLPELSPRPRPPPVEEQLSPFARLARGLARSTTALGGGIAQIFTTRKIDEASLCELEDLLITSDLGLAAAERLTGLLRKTRVGQDATEAEVRELLAQEVARVLAPAAVPLTIRPELKPHVVLVVGVNGTGKTTTIGKLAHRFRSEGRSVMMAAGDTFRAAAIDQLKIWGERTGAPVIAREVGADSAGLAFDALERAKAAGIDVLLIDTAGRLQNKTALMAELEKLIRVVKKLDPAAPHSVIQVLDATTGQNAIAQVEAFQKVAGVTGLVMTKLDGTARGGILLPLTERFALPIHAIGVGEAAEDLQPFDAALFARALAGLGEAA
jgi:fused signal recognition particle receptor